LIDGGVFSNINFHETINRCREEGFKDEDIIVDIVICPDETMIPPLWDMMDLTFKTATDISDRAELIAYKYKWYIEDLSRVFRGYPNVFFRHFIHPLKPLKAGWIPLFDGEEVVIDFFHRGYNDAKVLINNYLILFPEQSREYEDNAESEGTHI
jgi:hypothetical protein